MGLCKWNLESSAPEVTTIWHFMNYLDYQYYLFIIIFFSSSSSSSSSSSYYYFLTAEALFNQALLLSC